MSRMKVWKTEIKTNKSLQPGLFNFNTSGPVR